MKLTPAIPNLGFLSGPASVLFPSKLILTGLVALPLLLGGCGGDGSTPLDNELDQDAGSGDGNPSSITKTLEIPLGDETCPYGGEEIFHGIDEDGNGTLDEIEYDGSVRVCNGADGAAGAAGVETVFGIPVAIPTDDERCPSGGTEVFYGQDADGSGSLEEGEQAGSVVACNGDTGAAGSDGAGGADGADTIVVITPEPPGDNCTYGGDRIEIGVDADGSGVLEAGESTATEYVCSGFDVGAATAPIPLTIGTPYPGTIDIFGQSYYSFTTGNLLTDHTISLTATSSDLAWFLFSDAAQTVLLAGCDEAPSSMDESCLTPPLAVNTSYYLRLKEWSGVAGSYGVEVAAGLGEGSPGTPFLLAPGQPHNGGVAAGGFNYYSFTTGAVTTRHKIALSNMDSDLRWDLYTDAFQSLLLSCDVVVAGVGDEICSTAAALPPATVYYLAVEERTGITSGAFDLAISALPAAVSFNFDDGTLQGWSGDGTWGLDSSYYHSGNYSVTDSPGGNYLNNINISLISPPFDFTESTAPQISFFHHLQSESGWDFGFVLVSIDGGSTWGSNVAGYSGAINNFDTQAILDLSAYAGETVRIRFRFTSDGCCAVGDGWYLDDIVVAP